MSAPELRAWITLITGMSGSGKTTAVQALEDEGFYCIDNLPPSLASLAVDACLKSHEHRDKLAFVLDARSGGELAEAPMMIDLLRSQGHHVDVLFLDSDDDVLVRRFSETRRRHPMSAMTVSESIVHERRVLADLRALATRLIDTSTLSKQALRALVIEGAAAHQKRVGLQVAILSFGFKYGLPIESDMVFDVRHLANPFFVPELKPLTGLEAPVRDYVLAQPHAQRLIDMLGDLLRYLLPLYLGEGKSYLTIAIGCTGGKHRSVAIAEAVGASLAQSISMTGDNSLAATVSVRHRDIGRA